MEGGAGEWERRGREEAGEEDRERKSTRKQSSSHSLSPILFFPPLHSSSPPQNSLQSVLVLDGFPVFSRLHAYSNPLFLSCSAPVPLTTAGTCGAPGLGLELEELKPA